MTFERCFLVALGLLLVRPAHAAPSAADRDTARMLLKEGDNAFQAGQAAEALRLYLAADALMGVPTTGLAVARAYQAGGYLVEAHDKYVAVARSQPSVNDTLPFAHAREEARRLALEVDVLVPTLVLELTVRPEACVVMVDGSLVPAKAAQFPRRVNPGARRVEVKCEGFVPFRATKEVAEREHATLEIVLREEDTPTPHKTERVVTTGARHAPYPSPRPYPTWGVVALAAMGVGLTAGAVTGVLAIDSIQRADRYCTSSKRCTPEASDLIHDSKVFGTLSTAFFGVGVVGGLLGFGAWLTWPKGRSVQVACSGSYMVVDAKF